MPSFYLKSTRKLSITWHRLPIKNTFPPPKKKVCHSAICCTRFFPFRSAAPQRKALPRRPNQSILHYLPPRQRTQFFGRHVPQKCWQYIIFNMCIWVFLYHKYIKWWCIICIILCIVDTGIWFYIWFYLIRESICKYRVNIKLSCYQSILRDATILRFASAVPPPRLRRSSISRATRSAFFLASAGTLVVSILVEYWDKSSWPEKMCWKATDHTSKTNQILTSEDVLKSVTTKTHSIYHKEYSKKR